MLHSLATSVAKQATDAAVPSDCIICVQPLHQNARCDSLAWPGNATHALPVLLCHRTHLHVLRVRVLKEALVGWDHPSLLAIVLSDDLKLSVSRPHAHHLAAHPIAAARVAAPHAGARAPHAAAAVGVQMHCSVQLRSRGSGAHCCCCLGCSHARKQSVSARWYSVRHCCVAQCGGHGPSCLTSCWCGIAAGPLSRCGIA